MCSLTIECVLLLQNVFSYIYYIQHNTAIVLHISIIHTLYRIYIHYIVYTYTISYIYIHYIPHTCAGRQTPRRHMMWHMYDDVTYVWRCDICMMMWHMYDDVTYVWWCDICMMMWHMYDDVTCRETNTKTTHRNTIPPSRMSLKQV